MEGFGGVVVGSAVGGLVGAAAFFAVDGLMPNAAEASATPYAVASRMCEMMNNGVSRNKAWEYVITEYTQGQMGTMSATFGPPRLGGLGGGIGYGIAHGIQAGISLRNMRSEVFGLTSRMCPQSSGITRVPTQQEHIDNAINMVPTPWLDDFKPMESF